MKEKKSSWIWKHRNGLCHFALLGSLFANYIQCNQNDSQKSVVSKVLDDSVVKNVVVKDDTISFDFKEKVGLYAYKDNPFIFYSQDEAKYIPSSAEEACMITQRVAVEMFGDEVNEQLSHNYTGEECADPEQLSLIGFFDKDNGVAIAMSEDGNVVAINGIKVMVSSNDLDKYWPEDSKNKATSNEAAEQPDIYLMNKYGKKVTKIKEDFVPVYKEAVEKGKQQLQTLKQQQQREDTLDNILLHKKVEYHTK